MRFYWEQWRVRGDMGQLQTKIDSTTTPTQPLSKFVLYRAHGSAFHHSKAFVDLKSRQLLQTAFYTKPKSRAREHEPGDGLEVLPDQLLCLKTLAHGFELWEQVFFDFH